MSMNRLGILSTLALLAAGWATAANDQPLRIKGQAGGVLTIDAKGISLAPAFAACPASAATGEPFWALTLESATRPPSVNADQQLVLTDQVQAVRRVTLADGVRLVYDTLTDGSRTFRIALTLEVRAKADGFEVTGSVANDDKLWLVSNFTGPVLNGIAADLATHPVLMADGFGKRINHVPPLGKKPAPWMESGNGFEIASHYPGARGTMQWFAFAGKEGGLYVGSHDSAHRSKQFSLRYDPEKRRFAMAVRHGFFCRAGERSTLPPVMIVPYKGTWHAAANIYRSWVNSVTKLRQVPNWAREASGWLLCILKQQSGQIMWDYPSLSKLCDVADARGLDILGLFGWAHGGHDHLYPDYQPCPDMGGKEALKEALKQLRQRGKRSIIYANGQLQERGATTFWNETGKDIAILRRDGTTVEQTYHKFDNIPIYRFDLGCLHAPAWYDRMLALALQANELGADGILFDQLAMMAPMPCYGEGHGHPVPSLVHEVERPGFLLRIADHMRKLNPDFIVMTEGLHDCALDAITLFHGCELGMFHASASEIQSRLKADRATDAFPEMFRYTYPEVMSTVRVPTPMMDRGMANYTCTYGLRYEIESRYGPDVSCLLDNRVPDVRDYEHVNNKPDVAMMRATPPEEAARYLRRVIEFQRANASLFWHGRYTDDQGFSFKGDGLIAKGFEAGDRFGVVVWNPGDAPAPFTLSVPAAACVSASEPEKGAVEAFSDLAPQTVRLVVWKKNATSAAHAAEVAASPAAEPRIYPERWVYAGNNLSSDEDVEAIHRIIETAAEHGLNGMVLTGGFDTIDLQKPAYFRRLNEVKKICAERHVEIIPCIFSAGYGSAVLHRDRNLAEGLPVENALFVASGSEARFVQEPVAGIINGGFEEADRHHFKGFQFADAPGQITFQDTEWFKEGHASLRIGNAGRFDPINGHGRIKQDVAVTPRRCYRLSAWVKVEGLKPAGAFGLQVLADKRSLAPLTPRLAATGDWQKVTLLFNSLHYDQVRIYAGVWGGKEGRVWIDDLRLDEVGPVNVLRRPGTPVSVRSEDGQVLYEEGRDYAPLNDPQLSPSQPDHEAPPLRLLPGGRIRDSERLRVNWYHAVAIEGGQVTLCMSEPKVYDIWRTVAKALAEHLGARKFLLSMDEVRAGGSCAACRARHLTMGEVLGDCLTKQVAILREANPGAKVWCWSDMLDPNHNGHGDYYAVEGDFTGSWQHVPKDLGIICWRFKNRDPSLKFFSGLGFRTLAGAYYDSGTLDNPRGWLEALDRTPNAQGVMYTTWRNHYDLLAPFGDLATQHVKP